MQKGGRDGAMMRSPLLFARIGVYETRKVHRRNAARVKMGSVEGSEHQKQEE